MIPVFRESALRLRASSSQPLRRLRGFQRVTLAPGTTQTVTFTLDESDFGFYDNRGKFVVEPGEIDVFAGDSSAASLERSFTVNGWPRRTGRRAPSRVRCPA